MADSDTPPADLDTDILKAVEDTDPEPTPDPEPQKAQVTQDSAPPKSSAPAAKSPSRAGGFVSGILGGILVAVLCFSLVLYRPRVFMLPDTAALEQSLAAQTAETEALKARLAELAAAANEPDAVEADLTARLAALEARPAPTAAAPDLSPLTTRIDALEKHLADLEQMPTDGSAASPAAVAAQAQSLDSLKAEVEALKSASASLTTEIDTKAKAAKDQLDQARAEAEKMKAEAEEAGRVSVARAALGRVQAAFDSGTPFADALPDLGAAELPQILTDTAESGIPTLQDLQLAFPTAARAALEASLRADMGDSWLERAGSFFQSQTGARSLTPREGTDPDAILSRAEAALAEGQLEPALAELATLPPAGQAEMAAWVAQAQQRVQAEAAVSALVATLGQK